MEKYDINALSCYPLVFSHLGKSSCIEKTKNAKSIAKMFSLFIHIMLGHL